MDTDVLAALVPVAVALAGGASIPKLIDVWQEARAAKRGKLSPGQRLERAHTRTRLAIEWGHFNRVAAIKAGVPADELPKLELPDAYF